MSFWIQGLLYGATLSNSGFEVHKNTHAQNVGKQYVCFHRLSGSFERNRARHIPFMVVLTRLFGLIQGSINKEIVTLPKPLNWFLKCVYQNTRCSMLTCTLNTNFVVLSVRWTHITVKKNKQYNFWKNMTFEIWANLGLILK